MKEDNQEFDGRPEEEHALALPEQTHALAPRISAAAQRKFRIAGDLTIKAAKKLPLEQGAALLWLHHYATVKNLSTKDLSELVLKENGKPYNPNTIHQALSGNRDNGVGLAPLCEAINRLRQVEEPKLADEAMRQSLQTIGFVETGLTKLLWRVCEASRLYQRPAFVYGESQIGKTRAFEEYALRNPYTTTYLRIPTGGSINETLRYLARYLKISPNGNADLRSRIIECFHPGRLLIADECSECFSIRGGNNDRAIRTLNFLREIHDRTKCPLVLCGTKVFEEEVQGGKHAKMLRQLDLRKCLTARLPDKPSKEDLALFYAAFSLPAPEGKALDLEKLIIGRDGLGQWLTILTAGSRLCNETGNFGWHHVLRAQAGLIALGEMK